MNNLLHMLGIEELKPALGALLLPPIPLLLLLLASVRLISSRKLLGWFGVMLSCLGLWGMCTTAVGETLMRLLLVEPPALSATRIAELRHAPHTAIVVLGAGRKLEAPEYGQATLQAMTIERLRYGIWLARQTGLPLAYSGGLSYGSEPGPTEAEIAARIARQEFGLDLRWTEGKSRDTNENAMRTLDLLAPQGITQIVLVTHGFHMQRALANFERAQRGSNRSLSILPAPMDLRTDDAIKPGDWIPSRTGFKLTHLALHEWLGRMMGA